MYASPTKCTQLRRGVRMQKKKKKRDKSERVRHLTSTQQTLDHAGATHVLTVCSCPKGSSHKFAVFCKCYAFLRVGMARDRFKKKVTQIALFEFASATHANCPFRVRLCDSREWAIFTKRRSGGIMAAKCLFWQSRIREAQTRFLYCAWVQKYYKIYIRPCQKKGTRPPLYHHSHAWWIWSIALFDFALCDCEVSDLSFGNASTSTVRCSVKTLVVARVAGRFPADEQLTDCELTTSWLILWREFQDHAALSGNGT